MRRLALLLVAVTLAGAACAEGGDADVTVSTDLQGAPGPAVDLTDRAASEAAARARAHCPPDTAEFWCGTIVATRREYGPDDGRTSAGNWLATVVRQSGAVVLVSNIDVGDGDSPSEAFFALFPVGSVIRWDRDGDNNIVPLDEVEALTYGADLDSPDR